MSLRNLLYASVLATSLGSPQYASAQENSPQPIDSGVDFSITDTPFRLAGSPGWAIMPSERESSNVPSSEYHKGFNAGRKHERSMFIDKAVNNARNEGYDEGVAEARKDNYVFGILGGVLGAVAAGGISFLASRSRKEE